MYFEKWGNALRLPRIASQAAHFLFGKRRSKLNKKILENTLSNTGSGIGAYATLFGVNAEQTTHRYLTQMLNAKESIHFTNNESSLAQLAHAEIFVQWGIKSTKSKKAFRKAQRALKRPLVIAEDGFIRSVNIGLSGEPGLSIILDDTTAYYDAKKISRLQRLLENGPSLSTNELERANLAIRQIVEKRVSKYNHAPNLSVNIGTPGKKKILLIDQRFGDQSVESGMADEATFDAMLRDTVYGRTDCDVIVKQHPDAIRGGKSSYFNNERLASFEASGRLFPIYHDINPYALLDAVDEVYVATSGMGFEALMAGKVVHCYGAPFYAGWGVTHDRLTIKGRTRKRATEEIFHYAYIVCSRYFHPELNRCVELEELVDHIAAKRGW